MGEKEAKIFAALFVWAFRNDIEVTLLQKFEFDQSWPVLRFRRKDKLIEHAFWPLTDIKGQANYIWRSIGLELCVEPFEVR